MDITADADRANLLPFLAVIHVTHRCDVMWYLSGCSTVLSLEGVT